MGMILALAMMSLLAGLFYGLGSKRLPRALAAPPRSLPTARALPGGDPGRPIEVASPAVIDTHAARWPCGVCGGPVRCEHHRSEELGGRRLRVARVRCPHCGFERDLYFALAPAAQPN